MNTLKKILFPVFFFAFISFFLGHDIVNYCNHEKSKIENTAGGSGSRGFCVSGTSAEEDVSFFVQNNTTQSLNSCGKNLVSPVSILPPKLYYSIWLPPDNS